MGKNWVNMNKIIAIIDAPYGVSIVNKKTGMVGAGNLAKNKVYSEVIGDETTETAKKAFDILDLLEIFYILSSSILFAVLTFISILVLIGEIVCQKVYFAIILSRNFSNSFNSSKINFYVVIFVTNFKRSMNSNSFYYWFKIISRNFYFSEISFSFPCFKIPSSS